MKKIYLKLAGLVLTLMMLIISGCSSSYQISSWVRPGVVAEPYNKILIVGLINEPDRTVREKIEIHLADNLRQLGYVAVCACEEFQPDTFYGVTEEQMLAQMEENSFDAVLTVVLRSIDKQRWSRQGFPNTSRGSYHQLWSYYMNAYEDVYQQEKNIETVSFLWETNLYDLNDNGQVYSAQTRSFDPVSVRSMAREFSTLIVKDMLRKDILTRQSAPLKAF